MAGQAGSGTPILRRRLLNRVNASCPEIVSIVAPAGYGKSVLAYQIAGDPAVIVDCAGLAGLPELSARIVQAVALANPSFSERLAQYELSTAHRSTGDMSVGLAAYRMIPPEQTVVLDSVDELAPHAGYRTALEQLIAEGRGHRIVICSRAPLPVRLHKFARLEKILRVQARELSFDHAEIAEALETAALSPAMLADRVETSTSGWPIMVHVMVMLAQNGSPDDLPTCMEGAAFEDVYEYVLDEVMSALSPMESRAMLLCASLPNPTLAEIRDMLGPGAEAAVTKLAAASPFISCSSLSTVELHPTLRALLRYRNAESCSTALREAICAAHRRGDTLREAVLRMENGDQPGAAGALEPHAQLLMLLRGPSVGYAQLVSRIDSDVLLEHPMLWSSTLFFAQMSRPRAALLRDARIVWQRHRTSEDIRVFTNVCSAFLTIAVALCGERRDAEEALRALEACAAAHPESAETTVVLVAWRAVFAAVDGRNHDALDLWHGIEGVFAAIDATYAISLYDIVARVARCTGDREAERAALSESWDAAQRSGISLVRTMVAVEALFGTWLAGEDYADAIALLERNVDPTNERMLQSLLESLRGTAATGDSGYGPLKAHGYLQLMAIAANEDASAALRCAQRAAKTAQAAAEPFLQVLACVALAFLGKSERMAHIGTARRIAGSIESPELRRALFNIECGSSDYGMLGPFIRRILSRQTAGVLEISLLDFGLVYSGRDIDLTHREFELLCALAIERRPLTLSELAAQVFPEREPEKAENYVKVTIHRMRGKLGEGVINAGRYGYGLGAPANVDLHEIQQVLNGMCASIDRETLREQCDLLVRIAGQLLRQLSPARVRWEWLLPLTVTLRQLLWEQMARVGRSLAAQGELEDVLRLAHAGVDGDPCEETMRELAISAYLKRGDRAAALRELREYQVALRHELDAAPSARLMHLLDQPASPARRATAAGELI